MNELGIERLCAFGMPPVDFVELAADLGCDCVGIGLAPMQGFNPDNHPDWSLRDSPALRRELRAATRDSGVRISIVEGFAVAPGHDVRSFAGDLDLVRELGADRIACVSLDQDLERTIDGRPGEPSAVAYAGLYLASDEAKWVTGSNIVVDGGAHAYM